jgi:hypothetical protein
MNIKEAAAYIGIQEHSLRTAIRKGNLRGTMGVVPGTKIPRRTFKHEELDEYMANRGTVGTRADGRNKFVLYLTPEEATRLQNLLDSQEDEPFNSVCHPTRANPPKSK